MASGGGETINLDTLSVQQLSQVKKQLDEEIEHLTSSFTQLHAAQAKFRECLRCVGTPKQGASSALQNDKSVLVPLTNSLYVRGTLTNADHVLVDVGTGFYIEKSIESAAQFYESKVGQVGASLKELEAIVQGKTSNVRLIEDVLRQKMASQPQQAAAQS